MGDFTATEVLTIILSLVALIVTIIGFFASLKFYRDGVQMQNAATSALSRIEEKAAVIQTQVGGMFQQTLNAALGQPAKISEENQRKLLSGEVSDQDGGPEEGSPPEEDKAGDDRDTLFQVIFDYFSFKGMRYTDVSQVDWRAMFNLGAPQGFNLFDGIYKITFFGLFDTLDTGQILARAKFLINNINIAWARIEANPQMTEALQLMSQISIEVVIPESVDVESVKSRFDGLSNLRKIPITVHHPSDIQKNVKSEYENLKD